MTKVLFDNNVLRDFLDKKEHSKDIEYINNLILNKIIDPYFYENVFTVEKIPKKYRKNLFSEQEFHEIILEKEANDNNSYKIILKSKDNMYGFDSVNQEYLKIAFNIGFKVLPSPRYGKITNPLIKSNHYSHIKDFFEYSDKFAEVASYVESEGFGLEFLRNKIKEGSNTSHINDLAKQWPDGLDFAKAIAEWSDSDMIAATIAFKIAYLCTNDGKNNSNKNSVFGSRMKEIISKKYNIVFITPEELTLLFP